MRMISLDQIETGSFAPQEDTSHSPPRIRVVSWNIARGCHLDEITEFLADAHADLILLQEVDKHARRTEYRNVAELLAKRLRLNYAFGTEFHELTQGPRDVPAHHGQATLSRWPLCDSRILRFCRQSSYWYPRWWIPSLPLFQRRLGGRMALVSHVLIGERRIATYNLHLESRDRDELRRFQLIEALDDTRRYAMEVPVILAGDLNFDLREPRSSRMLEEGNFHNPFSALGLHTAHAHWFGRRSVIDWILTRELIVAAAPKIDHSVLVSDHYPLSLTIEPPVTP